MTIPPTHDDGRRHHPAQIPQNWPPYIPMRAPELISRELSFGWGVVFGGAAAMAVWVVVPVVAAFVLAVV